MASIEISLGVMNNNASYREECIDRLEDRIMELTQAERKTNFSKWKQSKRSLGVYLEFNIQIIGVPEGEENGIANVLKKLWMKTSLIWKREQKPMYRKYIASQSTWTQTVQN